MAGGIDTDSRPVIIDSQKGTGTARTPYRKGSGHEDLHIHRR